MREQEGRLVVRVELANQGPATARGMQVEGELLGARDEGTFPRPLPPGGAASVDLSFPAAVPRPGVHGLALHLRYWADGTRPAAAETSQRAYLLLALGANPAAAVRVSAPEARVARFAVVPVTLESADGDEHRVRLRALSPAGVNALGPDEPVVVPARGAVDAPLRVVRAGAPVGTRAGLVLMASAVDGALERTSVATTQVEIAAPPVPWLPRLRAPALAVALLLLAAAVAAELRVWRRR